MIISEVAQLFEAGGFVPDQVTRVDDDRFILVFDPEPAGLIGFCQSHPQIASLYKYEVQDGDGEAVLDVTLGPAPAMWGSSELLDALARLEDDPRLAALEAERDAAWDRLSEAAEAGPGDVWDLVMAEIAADTLEEPLQCAVCGHLVHRRSDAHVARTGHIICGSCATRGHNA